MAVDRLAQIIQVADTTGCLSGTKGWKVVSARFCLFANLSYIYIYIYI